MNRVVRTLAFATTAGAVSLALAVPTAAVAEDLEHQDRGQQDGHVVREDPEPRGGASSGDEADGGAAPRDDRAADAQHEPREAETARDTDGQQAEREGVESEGTESGERDERDQRDERDEREDSEPAEAPEDDDTVEDRVEQETAPTQRPEPAPRSEETQRPERTELGDGDDTPGPTARSGEPEGAPQVRDDTGTTTFASQRRATLTQLSRAAAYLSQARGRVDSVPIAPLFKQAMLAVLDERLRTVAGLIDHAEVVDTKAELDGVRRQALAQVAPQG